MDRWLSVVRGLLQNLGVEAEDSDESGVVTLYVDGDLPIFLLPGDGGATLVLHAGIGSIPDENPADVVCSLLEGNTLEMVRSGFAFGLVPGNDQVILIARAPVEGLEDDAAFALVERLVNTASGWRDIFDSLVASAEDSVDDADSSGEDAKSTERASDGRPPFEDFA